MAAKGLWALRFGIPNYHSSHATNYCYSPNGPVTVYFVVTSPQSAAAPSPMPILHFHHGISQQSHPSHTSGGTPGAQCKPTNPPIREIPYPSPARTESTQYRGRHNSRSRSDRAIEHDALSTVARQIMCADKVQVNLRSLSFGHCRDLRSSPANIQTRKPWDDNAATLSFYFLPSSCQLDTLRGCSC